MELNVCVVGCGDRGRAHAKAWQAHPSARVVAVSDTDSARARALADEIGATAHLDWREAISHPSVNVVSQCVPSFLHADVTCLAADHGYHVFGEKPLALTLDQGNQILDAVHRSGIVFMPCFQNRDRWTFGTYREAFRSGDLGTPVILRTTGISEVRPKVAMHRASMNGGPVIDMGCHMVDLLRWITGEEPEKVFATGGIFGRGKPHLDGVEDLAIDEACLQVAYSGGHQLQFYVNWGMPEGFRSLSDNLILGPERLLRTVGQEVESRGSNGSTSTIHPPSEGADPGLTVRIEQFLHAIECKAEPDITCEDAMIALRVSHAALRSIASGQVETP